MDGIQFLEWKYIETINKAGLANSTGAPEVTPGF
jgi:hypothetical protein